MNTLATGKIIALLFALLWQTLPAANDADAVDGPNVRVIRHGDGSKSVFTRSPDNKVITKKTYAGTRGTLALVTTYRNDSFGNPISCDITDGQGTKLYRVDYGYRKSDGQLVMERMFDCRVKRLDPRDPKQELPVQVVQYLIDAQGKRSKPIVTSTLKGGTFEEVYGDKTTAMDPKLFDGNKPVKPTRPGTRPPGTR